MALSATRVAAVLQFSVVFPRDLYSLAGIANPLLLVQSALQFLFFGAPKTLQLDNTRWFLGGVEWEYGVGPVTALLLVCGAVALILARRRRKLEATAKGKPLERQGIAAPIALVVLMALPLVVNWYAPAWNAVLKQVPLLCRIDTLDELEYYRNGGILQYVLRRLAA